MTKKQGPAWERRALIHHDEDRWNLMIGPHPALAHQPKVLRLFLQASRPNEDCEHDAR